MHDDVDDGLETWKNTSDSTFYVKVRGSGGAMEPMAVIGGRVFHIAPRDRRMNSLSAVSSQVDPFTNGTFSVLSVVETEADAALIKANPAQITDSEMVELYAKPYEELLARIEQITNPITLRRLATVGRDPKNDAAQAKVAAVEARLSEVGGRPRGSTERHAASEPVPSAGVPKPQEASFYDDLGPKAASIT